MLCYRLITPTLFAYLTVKLMLFFPFLSRFVRFMLFMVAAGHTSGDGKQHSFY